jgi:hypothetical protein
MIEFNSMRYFKSNSGTFGLETILLIAIVGIGTFFAGKHLTTPAGGVAGTPIENVQNINDKRDGKLAVVATKVNAETTTQLNEGQAAVHATGEAINQAVVKNASGGNVTRELETAKEINKVAQEAIDMGLNKPVDPKLLAWFIDSINKKNSEIAREREIGERMLVSKQTELIASAEREAKLIEEKNSISLEYGKKLAVAEKERDQWALENAAKAKKLDDIYFWIFVAAGIYGLSIVLPLASKLFPALGPISTAVSGLVAPGVQYLKSKSDNLAEDMIALHNQSKDFIEKIDPAKVEDFKKNVAGWWENDHQGVAAVESIKKKLRL